MGFKKWLITLFPSGPSTRSIVEGFNIDRQKLEEDREKWEADWNSRNAEIEKSMLLIEEKIDQGWTLQWVPPGQAVTRIDYAVHEEPKDEEE